MQAIERVLALVDLREDVQNFAKYAIETAARFSAELTLLHVENSNRRHRRNAGLSWPECAMVRSRPACIVHRAIVHGTAPDAVARYADFIDAGLIVLGGRGSSLWERLRGESTADRIARATNRPILVVKRSGGEGIHTASRPRILCVLSPAETGDAAIEFARWLAEQSDGELLFCTASGETDGQFPHGATQNPVYRPPVGRAITHLRRLGASTTAAQRRIFATQTSSRTLHTAVERLEADIIVAPRRAVGGDSRIHLGLSNALRNVERPIFLIAPDEHGARTTNEAPSPAEMLEYSTPHK